MIQFVANPDEELVAVLHGQGGKIICYSAKQVNKLPTAFIDRIQKALHIQPDHEIIWSNDIFNDLHEVPAAAVIFGQEVGAPIKALPRILPAGISKKWTFPEDLTSKALATFQAADLPELLQRKEERSAFMRQFRLANDIAFDEETIQNT